MATGSRATAAVSGVMTDTTIAIVMVIMANGAQDTGVMVDTTMVIVNGAMMDTMETLSGTQTNGVFMGQLVIITQQVIDITIILENMDVMSMEDMATITGSKPVHRHRLTARHLIALLLM